MLDRGLVLGTNLLERGAVFDGREHLVGVDAVAYEYVADDVRFAQLEAVVVAGGEEVAVHGEELLGEAVTNHDAGLQGDDAGVLLGLVPHIRVALTDVHLTEREGHEVHVPIGAGLQRGQKVFMGIAGEGTAVIPGHGERQAHAGSNPACRRIIPQCGFGQTLRAILPITMPVTAPATTSEA